MDINARVFNRIFELCEKEFSKNKDFSISTIQKFCEAAGITLHEFFSTPEFDSLEQEIK